MNRVQPALAVRSEADDLRVRSERLREQSRHLQYRSQLWRGWMSSAAHRDDVAAGSAAHRTADRAVELQRLERAEEELKGAIADCKCALEEVRRELRWQDPRIPPVVH